MQGTSQKGKDIHHHRASNGPMWRSGPATWPKTDTIRLHTTLWELDTVSDVLSGRFCPGRAINCFKIQESTTQIPHSLRQAMVHIIIDHYLFNINLCLLTRASSAYMWKQASDSLIFRDIQWERLRCNLVSFKMDSIIIFSLLLHGSGDICGYCSYDLWHMGTTSLCISI